MRRVAILLLVAGALACGTTDGSSPDALVPGTWGADGAAVMVTDSVVHVHIGCTFGNLPPGIMLDDAGRFTATGTYVLQAFPVAIGPELPAEFRGEVQERRLRLTVAVQDTVHGGAVTLGPVVVTLGRQPELGPCPICAAPAGNRLRE